VRDAAILTALMRSEDYFRVDVVVHLASQVAVTTSVAQPREDFEINALGTFNVLEAARLSGRQPIILYASTNKVYGGNGGGRRSSGGKTLYYPDLPMGCQRRNCWTFIPRMAVRREQATNMCATTSAFTGCPASFSARAASTARASLGIEDQGWVAWFIIAAVTESQSPSMGMGSKRVTCFI